MELKKLAIALCLLTSPLFALDFGDIPADTNVTTLWVAPGRTLTIGGVTFDLSANRTWTASTILDQQSTTQGAILYRGASNWVGLSPGTDGDVLTTHGAAANPTWTNVTSTLSALHFVTTQAESALSNEFSLGSLIDGIVKISVTGSVATPSSVAAPAGAIVGTTDIQHLQNKRITARGLGIVSSATPTINSDLYDVVSITALATNITSMTSGLSGTPNDFDKLIIRIKDLGGPWTIIWGASFVSSGAILPSTTVAGKVTTVGVEWDSVKAKWVCLALDQEP